MGIMAYAILQQISFKNQKFEILRFLQNHGAILITTKTNLQYELYLTGLENRLLNRTRQRKPVWICEDCKDGEC